MDAGILDLGWADRELLSRAHLEEAQSQAAFGEIEMAQHSLSAAQEALTARRESCSLAGPSHSHFPVQAAHLQIFQSRLAFQTFSGRCKPTTVASFGFASSCGHQCCSQDARSKGGAKVKKATGCRKARVMCEWRALLEAQLWILLEHLDTAQGLPLLNRYALHCKGGLRMFYI